MMRGFFAPTLALLCLVAQPALADHSPRRDAIDRDRLLGELDAATLGLENEFTRPRPRGEATLHGSATLQYVTPVGGHSQVAGVMFQGDALLRHRSFGLSLTPRLKINSFAAPLQTGDLFFQQAYAFVSVPTGEVKIGKVLGQLGRLWDYSLFGPAITDYDYKLTPDLGISFEGQVQGLKRRSISYALQYFVLDGRTYSVSNESLLSHKKARRQHNVTARVVPQGPVGPVHVAWGISGQTYQAIKEAHHQVWRAATDLTVDYKWIEGFVEVGRQTASDVSSVNLPVSPFNYLWAGAQTTLGPMLLRFHVNTIRHEAPRPGWGLLLQPGAEYVVNDNASLVVEGAAWMAQAALPVHTEQNVFIFAVLHD